MFFKSRIEVHKNKVDDKNVKTLIKKNENKKIKILRTKY